jgi:hypothetical protein
MKWLGEKIIAIIQWVFESVADWGNILLDGVLGSISFFLPIEYVQNFADLLAYVDYFAPLSEAVGFGSFLFVAWVVCAIYRAIKMWLGGT